MPPGAGSPHLPIGRGQRVDRLGALAEPLVGRDLRRVAAGGRAKRCACKVTCGPERRAGAAPAAQVAANIAAAAAAPHQGGQAAPGQGAVHAGQQVSGGWRPGAAGGGGRVADGQILVEGL